MPPRKTASKVEKKEQGELKNRNAIQKER